MLERIFVELGRHASANRCSRQPDHARIGLPSLIWRLLRGVLSVTAATTSLMLVYGLVYASAHHRSIKSFAESSRVSRVRFQIFVILTNSCRIKSRSLSRDNNADVSPSFIDFRECNL